MDSIPTDLVLGKLRSKWIKFYRISNLAMIYSPNTHNTIRASSHNVAIFQEFGIPNATRMLYALHTNSICNKHNSSCQPCITCILVNQNINILLTRAGWRAASTWRSFKRSRNQQRSPYSHHFYYPRFQRTMCRSREF